MREIGNWFGLEGGVSRGRTVRVLGCPSDAAATGRRGTAEGPAAIRHWSSTEEAVDEFGRKVEGLAVEDLGDVHAASPGEELAAIRGAAQRALADDVVLLGLGGDHSVTVPLVEAVAERHRDLAFLMLDAHADCFPDYEGDPQSHACTVARLWERGVVVPEHTALVGLRSYAGVELEAVARAGLMVPSATWLGAGAVTTAKRIREVIWGRPLYLSIDIDVLDPAAAPGTGYPVAGGPSTRDLLDLLANLLPAVDVVGADLVEVAPSLDPGGTTAAAAAHVLLQVLAAIARSAEFVGE